jgi:hypothetical protein
MLSCAESRKKGTAIVIDGALEAQRDLLIALQQAVCWRGNLMQRARRECGSYTRKSRTAENKSK